MIVVSLKYVTLVLRANNRGEGGIMALLALATSSVRGAPRLRAALLLIGVFGASLFYGDAVLTPAISVLSAVEGLEVGNSAPSSPTSCRSRPASSWRCSRSSGTAPASWACCSARSARSGSYRLGAVGIWNIAKAPAILEALDPTYALHFVTGHGFASFIVLGSVLLAITGAEALYADMGHFGARAIRIAWFAVAAPALVLNYFGQGALLIANPAAIDNPFYLAYPEWALYPMVVLATAATVIASQATISGAYSMTQQAIQLGYLPRMAIHHTSARTIGQIYVPAVNWMLLAAVAAAVAGFGSSSRLASAYGVAVMGTMLVTTLPHLLRASLRLALSAMAMRERDRVLHADRRRIVRGGDAQGPGRRLVFPGAGRGRVLHHGDLAERSRAAAGTPARRVAAAARDS